MKQIQSRQNPEIIAVAKLADAKERVSQDMFIAEGLRTCSALIESRLKLVQIYALESQAQQAKSIAPENKITLIPKPVLEKISQTSTPSGIVGVFRLPQQYHLSQLQNGIVMAQINDPGNMGTLIRTCAALSLKSVVVVEGCDPWSPKVVQATAGTIGLVDIYRVSWQELVDNKGSLNLCALVVDGGKQPSEITAKNTLLVVGNEAHGIPAPWIEDCTSSMTLPMQGNVESLNAAVAGSIALYALNTTNK